MAFPDTPVTIDPLVIFSILDHHIRADKDKRVLGNLMGCMHQGVLEIRSSLPALHNENATSVAIAKDTQRRMHDLHQRTNSRDITIGWYSTGFNDDNDVLIHRYYSEEVSKASNLLHLVVDPLMRQGGLNIRLLVHLPLVLANGGNLGHQWREIPFSWAATDHVAKQSIDMMINMRFPELKATVDPANYAQAENGAEYTISKETLHGNLLKISNNLQRCQAFVTSIVDNTGTETAESREIGRELYSILRCVPVISPEVFDRVFNDNLQDIVGIIFLTKLLKTQLYLMERLQSLAPPPSMQFPIGAAAPPPPPAAAAAP